VLAVIGRAGEVPETPFNVVRARTAARVDTAQRSELANQISSSAVPCHPAGCHQPLARSRR
jgi:hypothetical protein